MTKNNQEVLTPAKAYEIVAQKAAENNMSVSEYAESRGVTKGAISKWKNKTTGTITVGMFLKLGGTI